MTSPGNIAAVVLIVVGHALAGYGQFVMHKPGMYLSVQEEPRSADELENGWPVIAYQNLSSRMQRKFERNLAGKRAFIGSSLPESYPAEPHDIVVVQYQGNYYVTSTVVRHPTAISPDWVVSLGLLTAVFGWVWSGRWLLSSRWTRC